MIVVYNEELNDVQLDAGATEIQMPYSMRQFLPRQEIFKNFQATTVTNRFNVILFSLPHWIQHTRIRDENRDFRKSGKPLMKTGRGMPPMT